MHDRHQPGRRGEADPQVAAAPACRLSKLEPGGLDGREDLARPLQQLSSRFGQEHALPPPLEQLDLEFLLQGLDRQAERGLAHGQSLGRAPEVQFLGDGDEVAHAAQIQY